MNIYELLILQPIFNLLITIYSVIPWGDFGLALIVFTVFIRVLLYPLVKRQLHQTRMMRKLQPKLKEIKKKHKDNRQAEAVEMMDLYKRHGVSPFRSIGILLIQLPIFIALFHSIRIFTDDRSRIGHFTYKFLEQIEPVKQLIENPDSFNETMLGFIDLTKHAISANGIEWPLLIIAILTGVTQYFMSKQTMPTDDTAKTFKQIMQEAAEGKQTDQAEMNAVVMRMMVKVMPVMLVLIMVNLPGALALYYTVSNLIAVAQQAHLLRQDEEELEEIASEPGKKSKKPATKQASKSAVAKSKKPTQSNKSNRSSKNRGTNITRITAKDTKRPRRRKS